MDVVASKTNSFVTPAAAMQFLAVQQMVLSGHCASAPDPVSFTFSLTPPNPGDLSFALL